MKINSIDWRNLSQKCKNMEQREQLIGSFLWGVIGELCEQSHPRKLLFWAEKELTYLCSKWTYQGMWKVKGSLLPYFIAQHMHQVDSLSLDILPKMFDELGWNLDEALYPKKYISEWQTVEDMAVEIGDTMMHYDIAFVCCLPISFGTKYRKKNSKVDWVVQWWDNGLYELISDGGDTWNQTEEQLRTEWIKQ